MYVPTPEEELEFAKTSSEIEGETSEEAVQDHLLAWQYMKENQGHLLFDHVMECHRLLQKHLRPDIAGDVRHCDVRVGMHIMPKEFMVVPLLNKWIHDYANPSVFADKPDVDGEIRIAHVAFEGIHPFEDGNGRVGRILMNWHRINNDLPLLIVHPGDEQYAYYEWFKD